MLTVFRSVFPGGSGPAWASVGLIVGTLEAELVWPFDDGRWGSAETDTARADAGVANIEDEEVRDAGPMFETRDLGTGSDGRGPVGGAIEGRDGRGSVVVAMVVFSASRPVMFDAKSARW